MDAFYFTNTNLAPQRHGGRALSGWTGLRGGHGSCNAKREKENLNAIHYRRQGKLRQHRPLLRGPRLWEARRPYPRISAQRCILGDCLLYTSDAADDLLCVDLGGRRIIKKKK